jgi:HPt (histidine-containing phosphotransfer) domain-containing protein
MSDSLPNLDLDLTFLEEIADGSDEFIIESIDMFMVQTPQLMQDIAAGIASQNWPLTASASHKLKPNLGFFGMHVSQGLMQEIETMSKGGMPDVSVINNKYSTVKDIIDNNLNKLLQIKAERSA